MLDETIHQPHRLQIMALLFLFRYAGFRELRDELRLTEGNLAAHLKRLAEAGYVRRRTVFTGVRFEPRFEITPEGRRACESYRAELRRIVNAPRPQAKAAGPQP